MAAFSAMLFGGCKQAQTPQASATPALPSLPPAATQTPAPGTSALPSPTPFAVNPVYAFYAQFDADCTLLLEAYAEGLAALQTVEGLDHSLALTEHRALLSEGRITIGRLFGSDDGGYSGTLQAAAPGSGSMFGTLESGYTFTFTYADGNTLVGSFAAETLEFTVASAEGATLYVSMQKAGDVWTSTACTTEEKSVLTLNLSAAAGAEAIQFGRNSGNHIPFTEPIAAQEEE